MFLTTANPDVVDAITNAIAALTETDKPFTAYDVTRKARKDTQCFLGSHRSELEPIVRELYDEDQFDVGYEQTLIQLNIPGKIQDTFVYHVPGTDPYEYVPNDKDVTVVKNQ